MKIILALENVYKVKKFICPAQCQIFPIYWSDLKLETFLLTISKEFSCLGTTFYSTKTQEEQEISFVTIRRISVELINDHIFPSRAG